MGGGSGSGGSGDGLAEYRRRRDFGRTGEPDGSRAGTGDGSGGAPVFVVQHHIARGDHFDLRLQVGDVLKSWAVPKGPSTDPRVKRLALPTEDHPLDYADFEGTIAAGEYGGGTVQVWDRGTYTNATEKHGQAFTMEEGLEHGHLVVVLDGEKLIGGYALSRFRTREDGEAWLLVKERDAGADARRNPVSTENRSVETGRTLRQIARADGRTLHGRAKESGDG
ncbi:DNA polymerase ligase N-terminal domain-containing protein [Nocardiopsis coralliicola]